MAVKTAHPPPAPRPSAVKHPRSGPNRARACGGAPPPPPPPRAATPPARRGSRLPAPVEPPRQPLLLCRQPQAAEHLVGEADVVGAEVGAMVEDRDRALGGLGVGDRLAD